MQKDAQKPPIPRYGKNDPRFLKAGHLSQLKTLRQAAENALTQYPLRWEKLQFIFNGENTTYKVTDQRGKIYLLRLHRAGYHDKSSIGLELKWLCKLSRLGEFQVPTPVPSKSRRLLETCRDSQGLIVRHCAVFEWVHGRFMRKRKPLVHMQHLGELAAKLQLNPLTFSLTSPQSSARNYWRADGLLGCHAKFGNLSDLKFEDKGRKKTILGAKEKVLHHLQKFEKQNSQLIQFIHSDLHFGNLLFHEGKIHPIDFDDCGIGSRLYDLAIPLIGLRDSIEQQHKTKRKVNREYAIRRDSILNGYNQYISLPQPHIDVIDYYILARRLNMLAWMHMRSDVEQIRKYIPTYEKRLLLKIKQADFLRR